MPTGNLGPEMFLRNPYLGKEEGSRERERRETERERRERKVKQPCRPTLWEP